MLQRGASPLYGILYLERLANLLWHAPDHPCPLTAPPLSRGPIHVGQRWRGKIERELREPYGDQAVFARLQQLEKLGRAEIARLRPGRALLYGSLCKGTLGASSDLDLLVVARDRSEHERLQALVPHGHPAVHCFLLPPGPASRTEEWMSGPRWPWTEDLTRFYLAVLRQRGYDLFETEDGTVRVASGPTGPRRREVPLWLEHGFKITRPDSLGALLPKAVRRLSYAATGLSLGFPGLRGLSQLALQTLLPGHPPIDALEPPEETPVQILARRFLRLARQSSTPDCLRGLAAAMAGEPDLLAALTGCPPGQSAPRLWFVASQFLWGVERPLPDWPAFRRFAREHREELGRLVRERPFQLNNVQRCGPLAAGLAHLGTLVPGPFSLLEIGCSAGLLLRLDRYAYPGQPWGDPDSPVKLAVPGAARPPLPPLADRVGLDLHPLDSADPWLLAHVPPQESRPRRLLEEACRLAALHPVPVQAGGSERIPELLAQLSETPVVLHFHSLIQFSPEERQRFLAAVRGHYRLGLEWEDALYPVLRLHLPDGSNRALAALRGKELLWTT